MTNAKTMLAYDSAEHSPFAGPLPNRSGCPLIIERRGEVVMDGRDSSLMPLSATERAEMSATFPNLERIGGGSSVGYCPPMPPKRYRSETDRERAAAEQMFPNMFRVG